jgi:Transposase DDE domain group 1
MRSSHRLDRLDTAFDDDHLVADAGLLLPATLAHHLGLKELVETHLDLGAKPGRANPGDKLLTLVMSALAGGDCIDDVGALQAGGTARILGFTVKAASTLGTFLRSFRWGHVRQLDRVSRELLARAWAAGAGPGDAPLTIDLDSTICETYGLKKEGARHHGYTHVRGYHPLLAIAVGTGDVLMARLREGRANTARGAAHFLVETIGRVRSAGASGQLTVRADSGFYGHAVVAVCRAMKVRFSITIRQHAGVRRLIEAIPEDAWSPIPYWIDGGADVAETAYLPFADQPDPAPVRLIVRRVKPTPGSQLALLTLYDYHAFITDRDGEMLSLEADHRRHAEIENAIRDLKYGVALNHLPSGKFSANGAWLAVQVLAHNLARWTARIGLGEGIVTTKTLRRRLFAVAGRLTRSARRLTLHLPARWPWAVGWSAALAGFRALPLLA